MTRIALWSRAIMPADQIRPPDYGAPPGLALEAERIAQRKRAQTRLALELFRTAADLPKLTDEDNPDA